MTLNKSLVILTSCLMSVACGVAEPTATEQTPTRWSYSVEYVNGPTMAVTATESGNLGAGVVPLAIDGWRGVQVASEAPDGLGRATRELRIDGQAVAVARAICGVPNYSSVQSTLSVQGESRIAVVTLTCAD